MNFFDTSVLVAAAQTTHEYYAPSISLICEARRSNAACALHSVAELYATLSGAPRPLRMPREAVLRIVEQTHEIMRVVFLSDKEYIAAITHTANAGLIGGIVYDALLLQCARKVNAKRIYTWNARHFKLIAPDLSSIIVTP